MITNKVNTCTFFSSEFRTDHYPKEIDFTLDCPTRKKDVCHSCCGSRRHNTACRMFLVWPYTRRGQSALHIPISPITVLLLCDFFCSPECSSCLRIVCVSLSFQAYFMSVLLSESSYQVRQTKSHSDTELHLRWDVQLPTSCNWVTFKGFAFLCVICTKFIKLEKRRVIVSARLDVKVDPQPLSF